MLIHRFASMINLLWTCPLH